ncbi:hypothetical protein ACJMK2_021822 [Sinanodonta woodiana]|uniref:Uncharacterized protein n=1 Tax=Sinanodonta woodiana TaxID=1069815 RepID=A0ABD3TH68_SINWO
MDICNTKSNIENNDCNKYAIDFELLLALDGLDVQYEVICPESLNPNSDSQCPDHDQFLENFCSLSTNTVLPSTKKEEINDDTGTVNPSVSSQFTEDTSAMRGKEGNDVQKQKYIDFSFSDELDIEEVSVNLPALDDTGTVNPFVIRKVQIISKKSRKVEPSLLVQLLKGLTSRKANEYWMNHCNEYFNNGRGLCCNNNCCMGWKHVDIKTILSTWF